MFGKQRKCDRAEKSLEKDIRAAFEKYRKATGQQAVDEVRYSSRFNSLNH